MTTKDKIIDLIDKNSRVDAYSISDKLGLSLKQVRNVLGELRKIGRLQVIEKQYMRINGKRHLVSIYGKPKENAPVIPPNGRLVTFPPTWKPQRAMSGQHYSFGSSPLVTIYA